MTTDPLDTIASDVNLLTQCNDALNAMTQTVSGLRQRHADDPAAAQLIGEALARAGRNLKNFNRQAQPVIDLLDAVHTLRNQGPSTLMGALQEIQAERQIAEETTKERETLATLQEKADALQQEIDTLAKDPKNQRWLVGGLKGNAAHDFTEKSRKLEALKNDAQKAAKNLDALTDPRMQPGNPSGAFAKEKEKLRELLDISPQEHRDRQQKLIKAALDFVKDTDAGIASVLQNLGGATPEDTRAGTEAARIAAEAAAWEGQGCPTTAPVTVMRPLKIRKNAAPAA